MISQQQEKQAALERRNRELEEKLKELGAEIAKVGLFVRAYYV